VGRVFHGDGFERLEAGLASGIIHITC
jgi:hypothetical protein